MRAWRTGWFLLAMASAVEGRADPPPTEVTIDDVLRLLRERSPRVAAERATLGLAEADVVGAGVHPNPTMDYAGTHLIAGDSTGAVTTHQLALEQPLLLFGQRGTRIEAAKQALLAERARVAAGFAAHALEARQAFAALLVGQDRVARLDQTRADLERVGQIVHGRAEAGERSRYDVLRVEADVRKVEADLIDARAEAQEAAGRLGALLGLPGWQPHARGSLDPIALPVDVERLWQAARARKPALVAARRRLEAAGSALRAARREAWPVPALQAGAVVTREVAGTSFIAGLELPLPLFDRNQGGVARAGAQADVAGRELLADESEARADIERAAALLVEHREALARLREGFERLPEMQRMAEEAYRNAKGSVLDLLDAFRSLKDLQLEYLDHVEVVKLAEADLIAAAALDEAPL
jgi:outer membrane protein, heavy metal efflux system